jgi:hypothetical protein
MPCYLRDGSDHRQPSAVEVEGIGTQARHFTPTQASTRSSGNDGVVPLRNHREKPRPKVRTRDDPLVGVATPSPRDAYVLGRVERD